ncbi:hypothetical protein B0T16DRAFT_462147 [Cercophora newfieldiana]|uniref:Uncharacterized protein n=1 Tax=Cercophora newfieldiana TaxID=92897 RepID=A0AA40CLT1_9PEZI|nr:hypothetical protein B0T16DRAFT_462147 [Cercophora newfieldiana]
MPEPLNIPQRRIFPAPSPESLSYPDQYRQGISPSPRSYIGAPDALIDHPHWDELNSVYSSVGWCNLRPGDRKLRLRSMILFMSILGVKCFGMEELETSGPEEFKFHVTVKSDTMELKRTCHPGDIEHGLQRFEQLLHDLEVPIGNVDDWRIATMKCVRMCKVEPTTVTSTARDILLVLEPLLIEPTGSPMAKSLEAAVLELCQDAFNFKMLTRESREGYIFQSRGMKSSRQTLLSKNETHMEVMAVESGDIVAYTIFGGLLKKIPGQQTIVLEKAQVVMKRKEDVAQ